MKRKVIFLLILILLFGIFIFVRFFWLNKENNAGRLRILSTPPTTVFIDNVAVGKTPYEEKVNVGEVMIKLIPEGEGSQTAPWQGKVTIYKNAMTYVNRDLGETEVTSSGEVLSITRMENKPLISDTGEIYIETEPSGAIVYLDNDEKGVSPLLMQNVAKGDHELSVFMPGFWRRTQKVNTEIGYKLNAQFKLALDPTNKTLDETLQEKRQEASAEAQIEQEALQAEQKVVISNTPTGFLRVRAEASVSSAEIAQVKPGESFDFIEETNGWFKISVDGKEGWVSTQYAKKEIPVTITPTAVTPTP